MKNPLVCNARIKEEGISKAYYGMNIAKAREPLDQADFLFLARRFGFPVTVFVAGKYGILNGKTNVKEMESREQAKKELFLRLFDLIGVDGKVLVTKDIWSDPLYWNGVLELSGKEGIISDFKGPKLSSIDPGLFGISGDALSSLSEVVGTFGSLDAPSLYTLLEVAEAFYLKEKAGINCKMGPRSEEMYDVFIQGFMGIVQLYQPLDIRSSLLPPSLKAPPTPSPDDEYWGGAPAKIPKLCVRGIVPYMDRDGENDRIFLGDGKDVLISKLYKSAQRAEGTSLLWKLGEENTLNAFTRFSILAVEAASAADALPLQFKNRTIYEPEEVVELYGKSGMLKMSGYAGVVAEALWNYLILPVKKGMGWR